MWYEESVFYQIYPLGACGAPIYNDGVLVNRINKLNDYIDHLKRMNVNAIYLSPIFESDKHGYDTRDYQKIDVRLGSNEDFKKVVDNYHQNNIKVVIDGVFNHVGRGFFAFQDVLNNRENSRYLNWFYIDLNGNSNFDDHLYYEGWEGCYDLVKLNLNNEEVVNYLFESIKLWVDEFDIDGLRLDVAYSLDHNFLRRLRSYTDSLKGEFFLLGETLFGDYNQLMNNEMCHSVTNYECYKGIHSSFNSYNMFEIIHSLLRQFGKEEWTLYKGKHLLSFVDNHDVSRIASILDNSNHIPLAYALMYTMPGIPCVYYGSEFNTLGDKSEGDDKLRPYFDNLEENDLFNFISKLGEIKINSKALNYGNFTSLQLTNKQCVFERSFEDERIIVAINIDESDYHIDFNANAGRGINLLNNEEHDFGGGSNLKGYSAYIFKCLD